MGPEEIERVVGQITEKDVMSFAQRKLWDQDVAVSAVGSIEGKIFVSPYSVIYQQLISRDKGLFDYNRIRNDMSRNA